MVESFHPVFQHLFTKSEFHSSNVNSYYKLQDFYTNTPLYQTSPCYNMTLILKCVTGSAKYNSANLILIVGGIVSQTDLNVKNTEKTPGAFLRPRDNYANRVSVRVNVCVYVWGCDRARERESVCVSARNLCVSAGVESLKTTHFAHRLYHTRALTQWRAPTRTPKPHTGTSKAIVKFMNNGQKHKQIQVRMCAERKRDIVVRKSPFTATETQTEMGLLHAGDPHGLSRA